MVSLFYRGFCAVLLAACVHVSPAAAQTPAGTAFFYQGSLIVAGAPANGDFDFQFKLFDAAINGNQIGDTRFANDVSVAGGLFAVSIDFGEGVFTSDARWLEIGVRPGASGNPPIVLTPRQRIAPTPVAIQALNDANWTLDGTAIHNTNDGFVGMNEPNPLAQLHVTGISGLDNLDPSDLATDQIVIEGGQAWLGLYSDNVGAPGSGISLGEIDTATGELTKWSLVQRTAGNGGDFSITYGSDPAGNANARYLQVKPTGDVGISVNNPAAKLHVKAVGTTQFQAPNALRVTSEYPSTIANTVEFVDIKGNEIHAVQDDQFSSLELQPDGGDVVVGTGKLTDAKLSVGRSSAGVFNSDLQFEEVVIQDSANAWLGLYSDDVGNVGSGITFGEKGGNVKKWAMYARTTQNVGDLVITYGTDTNPTANEKMLQIDRDGTTKVKVIEILGADVAERFPCSEPVEPGQVLMIDAENPGQLCLSRGSYNRKVAGVVSGAGDLPAGAVLGNLPGNEEAPAVALSGRVWVHCDASDRAITPGDLMTTGDRPGYAMAVEDHARATGAVIGKAMTPLAKGERGLVLVLVNLQ